MFKRIPFVAGALVTASLLTLGTLGPAAMSAHAAAPAAQVLLHGVLQAGFGTTAPTTLQILTPKHGMFTINVSTSTNIIRRYNGQSGLDELSPGDNLVVQGAVNGTATLNAVMVKDWTIQKTFAVSVDSITSINTNQTTKVTSLTLKVVADSRYGSQNPFNEGETIYANMPATTAAAAAPAVIGSDGSATTADALYPGEIVTIQGVFNRHSSTYLSVWRLRIGAPKPGVTIEFHGQLQSGFGTAAPTTLSIMTPLHGLVTFSVASTTGIIRRYNGTSSLAELSAGDNLLVFVRFTGPMNQPYPAMVVKDISIQAHAAATVGTIKTISGNTVTVTVMANGRLYKHQDAFKVGETVTLNVSASTKIILANGTAGSLSSLQPNMKIWVNGVANRKAHSYTTVDRIRVL
jgi:hypothetical protein